MRVRARLSRPFGAWGRWQAEGRQDYPRPSSGPVARAMPGPTLLRRLPRRACCDKPALTSLDRHAPARNLLKICT